MRRSGITSRSAWFALVAAVLAALTAAGCGHPRRIRGPEPGPALESSVRARTLPTPDDLDALLGLPDGDLDPVWAALRTEAGFDPRHDSRASLAVADRLAEAVAPKIEAAGALEAKARRVGEHVFGVARFRVPDGGRIFAPDAAPVSVADMLASREGTCFTLSILYVGVCRRLGIPARISLVPYHAFVTLDDGVTRVHVETTEAGRVVDIRPHLAALGLRGARIRTLGDRSTLAAIQLLATSGASRRAGPDGARRVVERALALDPGLAEAWSQSGALALLRNDPIRAEACFSKAIGLEPGNPQFWIFRGASYAEAGRADEAAALYARALESPIRIPLVWERLGWFLCRRGQHPPAVRCFNRALGLEPERTRSLEGRGVALAALGELGAAARALQRAVAREPENPRLREELTRVREAANRAPRRPPVSPPEKP